MNRLSYHSNTKPRDIAFVPPHVTGLAALRIHETSNPLTDETSTFRKQVFQGQTNSYPSKDKAKTTCKSVHFHPRVTICATEKMTAEEVSRMWYANEEEHEFLKNMTEEVKHLRRKLIKKQSVKTRESHNFHGTMRGIEHLLKKKDFKQACDEQSSVIRGVLDKQEFLKSLPALPHHLIYVEQELAAVSSSRSRNAILRAYKNARRNEDDNF